MKKMTHLNAFVIHSPMNHSVGSWIHPDSEVGKIYGATIGCPQLVGTPEQIADQMEAIIDETGGDGFNITPTTMPNNFREFVDEVVPILQKRGRHRRGYSGTTLRDHLNQVTCE